LIGGDNLTLFIISRHKATQEFLTELLGKWEDNVIILEHLDDIKQIPLMAKVAGNLPINMIAELVNKRRCTFYYVSLEVPKELRGKELDFETLKKYAKIYKITHISLEQVY